MRNLRLTLLSICLLLSSYIKAQESILSSGNTITVSNGSISYSIGQNSYNSYSSASGELNEGVQHPFEFYVLSIRTILPENSIEVFPNPAGDYLNISISKISYNNLSYELRNAKSTIIASGNFTAFIEQINISNISSGIYFLEVFESEESIKTLKIIKS
ncbi:T9SS type A sorting domain-containing protein [Hyphobacterium sp. CCMP332]|nr:T9SS type A sorting domain-containing protein [Hyphobacterium sp. CCMP332]